jgi:holo-[acyl-carrier protein] synthase
LLDEANRSRFAVKEAVIKAHPSRKLTFHDIVVLNDQEKDGEARLGSGPPRAYVQGKEGKPDQEVRVSISHDGNYATAVCMGVEGLGTRWRFRRGRLVVAA